MFSKLSRNLTNELDNKIKKEQGIYFSPKNDRDIIIKELKRLKCIPINILEPSCGSCEFITDCLKEFPKAHITGIEYNKTIYDGVIKHYEDEKKKHEKKKDEDADVKNMNSGRVTLLNKDTLLYNETKHDLIIGNPPYFVVTKKEKEAYSDISIILQGKMNIYIYFMYHCIKNLLKQDGYMAFIIPSSLKNCIAYNDFRKYVSDECIIHNIISTETKDFIDTDTNTIIIILQKKKSTDSKFILNWGNNVFFSEEYEKFTEYNNKKTLCDLGVSIKTGNIVWNQVKEYLTDDDTQKRLIYDTNFRDSILKLDTIEFKKEHCKPTNKKYDHVEELEDTSLYGKKWHELSSEEKTQVETAGYIIDSKEWSELSLAEKKRVKTSGYIMDGKKWTELSPAEQTQVQTVGYIIYIGKNEWNNTLPKKQYISIDKKSLNGPVILLNRGHGNTTYKSKTILLDDKEVNFHAENHVYVLSSNKKTKRDQLKLLEKIQEYLLSDTYNNFIKLYVGNGAISKKELEEVFPIVINDV